MPKAVISDELGPLENYTIREHDPGMPGPGQILVAVKAAGVSFVDVLNAKGQYQGKAPVPFIPGSEFSGVVEAVGEVESDVVNEQESKGVNHFAVGDKVLASSWGGAFAEAIVIPAKNARRMPKDMSFAEAAVFKVSALTSWHALVDRGRLQQGETVLVLGAGGATGYAAVQIAKYLGARVIASASSEQKRQLAIQAGADVVIDSRSETWREEVMAANAGKPLDVVFDPVGGDSTELAFRCLGWEGRHLIVGFPGGIAALPTNLPLLKSASLVGVNLQQLSIADPLKAEANMQQLSKLAAQGLFKPAIAATYPLAQFQQAMELVAEGKTAGRIVLQINEMT